VTRVPLAAYFTMQLQLAESYLTPPVLRQNLGRIEQLVWHPMGSSDAPDGKQARRRRECPSGGCHRRQAFGGWGISRAGTTIEED